MKADGNPLAQNELGRRLTTWSERIEPHTNKILAGLLAITVGVVLVMVLRRAGAANTAKVWTEFYECRTAADYETFVEDFPASPATSWARVEAARQRMIDGYRLSLTNRSDSVKGLKKAQEHFRAALQGDAPPEIRERALAGLAMAEEALCSGDTKPVVEAYKKLLQEFPETYYKKWAEHRIELLGKPETGEFYAWYAKQDPKPTDRPAPQDGRPIIPGIPGGGDLPKLDDIFSSDLMKELKEPVKPDSSKPEAPKTEAPKPGEEPKADAPKADAPKTDAPKTDAPKTEGDKPAAAPELPKPEKTDASPATPPKGEEKPAEPAADAKKE